MRTVNSWILKLLVPRSIMSIISLSFLVWIVQSLRLTDLLNDNSIGIKNFVILNLYLLPSFAIIVLPISLSLAFGFTLMRLKKERVFTTVQSLAIQLKSLVAPMFLLLGAAW